MNKILVTFGDSWVWGDELPDTTRNSVVFGAVLKDMLNYNTFVNYGIRGGSIGNMAVSLEKFLATEYDPSNEYLLVFGLTTASRSLGYSSSEETWFELFHGIQHSDRQQEISKFYHAYMCDPQYQATMANIYLGAIQSACLSRNIKFLMFAEFEDYTDLLESPSAFVNKKYFYNSGKEITRAFGINDPLTSKLENGKVIVPNLVESFANNPNFNPGARHPNEQGHRIIAEQLYRFIINSVLDQ